METAAQSVHRFAPDEQPLFPGAPYVPKHPLARRLGYATVALTIGICATLGNALVQVNVNVLAGSLGDYVVELSWLPAIYVAFNVTANLLLIKARLQFGIQPVTFGLLIAYALVGVLQLFEPGFVVAAAMRALSGLTAAGLTTLAIYNMIQAFPAKIRPLALAMGIISIQFGPPLARLFPVEMLATDSWLGLRLIELALPLIAMSALSWLPLPPSDREKAFEPLDALTIGLVLPALLLLCGVLNLGRLLWWAETPWLGWALAGAIVLFAAAIVVEQRRARPLLQLGFMTSGYMLRVASVAFLVRVALAEQNFGAVGLLTSGGLNNDQLHTLFAIVVVAMVLGAVVMAATFGLTRLPYQIMCAALLIALGAALDTQANALTRPAQLYFSQALIAFGTMLFIGPAIVIGFIPVLRGGAQFLISFIVLFNTTQNLGGLVGSALLGSYQVMQARAHAVSISEHLLGADPQVAARLQSGAAALGGAIADPGQRAAQGAGLLSQALTREANVLAYNDVFSLVVILALGTALYVAALIYWRHREQLKGARP